MTVEVLNRSTVSACSSASNKGVPKSDWHTLGQLKARRQTETEKRSTEVKLGGR